MLNWRVPGLASKAPTSQVAVVSPLPSMGRVVPRWSVLMVVPPLVPLLVQEPWTASMAVLPERRAWVWVGPPLLASGPRLRVATLLASPVWVKAVQVPSLLRLLPRR
ncbi:MAG: hypothetical protein U0821_15955 [Chloroflexota bacterium]